MNGEEMINYKKSDVMSRRTKSVEQLFLVIVILCFGPLVVPRSGYPEQIGQERPEPVCRPPVSSLQIPAKLTFCGEPVPLDRADVRERFEREFYYLLDKEGQLLLYVKRAGRTDPVVTPILKKAGIPLDLKYVPVAESGLVFRARSDAGAVGYWQFMRDTARQYGLEVNAWVDERRSLPMSTRAAARFLKVLHEEFGSWTTALAAYNWGRTNLARAVKDQGTRNYYDLYLPDETERYVFQILVLMLVLEDPPAYGLIAPDYGPYRFPETDAEKITSRVIVPMTVLAPCAQTPPRNLRHLNPWMLRNAIRPGTYTFELPQGNGKPFKRCMRRELQKIRQTVHVVKRGEYLLSIAEQYGVTVTQIEDWNNINSHKPIHPGQRLVILVGK